MAAIYTPLWPKPDEIVTTTLYPIDTAEYVMVSAAITTSSMSPIPSDEVQTTFDVQNSTYTQLRWFYVSGPYDDAIQTTFDVQDSTYVQLRWFYTSGPHDDSVQVTFDVQDSTLTNKLIEADSEIEELSVSAAISTNSSMSTV